MTSPAQVAPTDLSTLPEDVRVVIKYAAFLCVTNNYEPDKVGIVQSHLRQALAPLLGTNDPQEIRNAGAALSPLSFVHPNPFKEARNG